MSASSNPSVLAFRKKYKISFSTDWFRKSWSQPSWPTMLRIPYVTWPLNTDLRRGGGSPLPLAPRARVSWGGHKRPRPAMTNGPECRAPHPYVITVARFWGIKLFRIKRRSPPDLARMNAATEFTGQYRYDLLEWLFSPVVGRKLGITE